MLLTMKAINSLGLTWWRCRPTQETACYREEHIPAGRALSLQVEPESEVIVKDGMIWMTHSGLAGDHVVRQGEQFALHAAGVMVIESLAGEDAHIEVRSRRAGACMENTPW